METLIIVIIAIANFILQSTIFNRIAVLGVVPNTALIIVVSLALIKGERTGSLAGLFIGLLQDIFFSVAIGSNALVYFFIGYGVAKIGRRFYKDSPVVSTIFIIISTVAHYLFYYLVMYFLGQNVSFISAFKNMGIIEVVYNSILAIPIYKWFLKIFSVPSMKFRRS